MLFALLPLGFSETFFHWKFDLPQGVNIGNACISDTDSIGGIIATKKNGTSAVSSNVLYSQPAPGTIGTGSLQFLNNSTSNNDGSYLNILDNNAFTNFSTLVLEAKINASTLKQSVILRKYANADQTEGVNVNNGYWLDLRENGSVVFHIGNSSNYVEISTGENSIVANQWYHIRAVWDGSHAKIFLDNTLKSTLAYTGTLENTAGNLGIGAIIRQNDGSNTGQFFHGYLDEIMIGNNIVPEPATWVLLLLCLSRLLLTKWRSVLQ